MKMKAWLTINNKSQKWLADQLDVTEGRISQVLNSEEGLPYAWAPDIIRLTNGEVSFTDEWPESWAQVRIRRRKNEQAKRPSKQKKAARADAV